MNNNERTTLAAGDEEPLDAAARELESGNGCGAKLLLDATQTKSEHDKMFAAIKDKHAELYPDSTQEYKSVDLAPIIMNDGMNGDSEVAPQRSNTTISVFKEEKRPGFFWGTNVYSGRINILEDQWIPDSNKRSSSCQDLSKPGTQLDLPLTGFE